MGDTSLKLEDMPLMLSVEQVLPHLQVARSSLYEAIKAGQVPSVRIGRKIRIPRAWLEQVASWTGESFGGKEDGA